MALVTLPWVNNKWLESCPPITMAPQFSSLLLDAAADRVVFAGRFIHKSRGTVTLDGVGFSFGTVSKAGLSTLKVSLQNVDLVNGPVIREDATQDQTLSIANADASFISNTWYEGAFDSAATRSITHGDLLAIVIQFDSFVAGDTVNIRGLGMSTVAPISAQGVWVTNLTGTYAAQAVLPNVALRCTDGSYGTIENSFIASAINTLSIAANTAGADEYATGYTPPIPQSIDGLWAVVAFTTAGDTTELLVYDGTTALATITIDHNAVASNTERPVEVPFPSQTLTAGALYRLAIRPVANNAITFRTFDVAFANHLQCHPGGVDSHLWTRLNQGTWGGEVTTKRLFIGVRPCAYDDGVGGGGETAFVGIG